MSLIAHELSHCLLGGSIALFFLYQQRWNSRLIVFLLGALAGITPDLFGARDLTPWSHSIIFAPLLVFWIVIIGRVTLKQIDKWKLWIVLSISLILGHLFYDYLGHDVPLLYPFSNKSYALVSLTLGDPWLLLPLLISIVICIFLNYKSKLPITIAMLLLSAYLSLHIISKEIIEHKVRTQYAIQDQIIIVEPDDHYGYEINPLEWLNFRYEVLSKHFTIGGTSKFFGNSIKEIWHNFYPVAGEITYAKGTYRRLLSSNTSVYSVTDEWENNDIRYIKATLNGNDFIFKNNFEGEWLEVQGQEKEGLFNQSK